jgi:hypothetical protein
MSEKLSDMVCCLFKLTVTREVTVNSVRRINRTKIVARAVITLVLMPIVKNERI